ncbi:MAG: VWA domain-containing protein [Bacteroidota bacterium]
MLSSARKVHLREGATYSRHRGLLLGIISFLIVVFPSIAFSQPILSFKRVMVNWPTIELYMGVGCDGNAAYHMTKENFRITENGKEIKDFTLWCSDPALRCPASVAIVADVSGSMYGAGMTDAARNMHAFIDLLDGNWDDAALITAGREPQIRQRFTTNKNKLNQSVDSLQPSGGSSLYDGIILGIHHLVDEGYNQCRALIVFTDGWDNTSSATVQEIISLANRNRIRLYTIGVGSVMDPTTLEMLALLTGGRNYQHPNVGQMVAIFQEVTATMWWDPPECIITYERGCADGSMRTVNLELKDFCGGNDAKTKTYRAPLDSTTFAVQRLRIGETTSGPRDIVTVPLSLERVASTDDSLLYPFEITISSGNPRRPLVDAFIPSSSPLYGKSVRIERYPDSVRVRLDEIIPINENAELVELQYLTAGVSDSTWFPLSARLDDVGINCAITKVDSRGYRIVPRLLPRIMPEGEVLICERGGLELSANDGFVGYHWSTGERTRSIWVMDEGSYYLDVVDGIGDTLRSAAVSVRIRPERKVWLEASGPLAICHEGSVNVTIAGDTVGTQFYWLNDGHPRRTISARAPAKIWGSVVDQYGCRSYTDTLFTIAIDPSVTLNVPGDTIFVCRGDSIALTVLEDYPAYFWSTGFNSVDSSRSIFAHPDGGYYGRGDYAVSVRDANGCTGSWHNVRILEYPERSITFRPSRRIVLCPGGEVEVSMAEEFASYLWSTGDTSKSITLRNPGTLTVEGISAEGCVTASETLVVEMVDIPHPRLSPVKYAALCPKDRVQLDAGEGYAAYRWSTGDTTRMISVSDPSPFFVDVMAYGGCWGRSDTITVQQEMDTPPEIRYQGSTVLCHGDSLTLEAPEGYVVYRWNTRDTTRTITVHTGGKFVVVVLSAGGCEGISNAVSVQVRQPDHPTILKQGLTLSTTTRVLSHQWFLDGQPISGATGPVLDVTQTGRYTVQVVDSCGAVLLSKERVVTTLGIAVQPEKFSLEVYPDPSDGLIHVAMTGVRGAVQAELLDLLGRSILRTQWSAGSDGTVRETLTFRNAPRGLYLLRLAHRDGVLVRRLIKE